MKNFLGESNSGLNGLGTILYQAQYARLETSVQTPKSAAPDECRDTISVSPDAITGRVEGICC
jgi:hypothetical protein